MKASWRGGGGGGGGGVVAKNTFKIGGGPLAVLSSGRSTPQTLNSSSSFISAFITVRVLSSSTFSRLWFFFFFNTSSKEDPNIKTAGSRFEKTLSLLLLQINVFKSRYVCSRYCLVTVMNKPRLVAPFFKFRGFPRASSSNPNGPMQDSSSPHFRPPLSQDLCQEASGERR